MFEKAARTKLRFPSTRGELSAEQLWDLPLTSRSGFDLDTIAREINQNLKASTEDSFVTVRVNPMKDRFELSLDILKHIIQVKLDEIAEAAKISARRAEKSRLVEILDQKKDQALLNLTPEEIQQRIAALEA
jgi:hypothetical protein